jgi:hypothetical protein
MLRNLAPYLALLALLSACAPDDADGDGALAAVDCDDQDANVRPGATEVCNDIDDDCDGEVDEDPPEGDLFYADADADGYGDPEVAVRGCDTPEGYVTDPTDCDDADAAFHPGADETDCEDPADYNCDGVTNDVDADGDGVKACDDCDDDNPDVRPGVAEACNGDDDDCDGEIDESGAVGETNWFIDADADGFGHPSATVEACDAPEGYAATATDCNDASADARPGGVEVCDGLDNDCDGAVDGPTSTDAQTYYADRDGDGVGDDETEVFACAAPPGHVTTTGDCDDTRAAITPGKEEACDLLDNNCDGAIDEGLDLDGDGMTPCTGDCDETRADVKDGAPEVCDGADNNCDGSIDADPVDGRDWYVDYDADGYGSRQIVQAACSKPAGFVDNDDDCADTDAARNPGATPVCDGRDLNCDGFVDNDADRDTFPAASCGGSDCDDARADVKPGAAEVEYDGRDNDCNPSTRDDDLDADGYPRAADCDDRNANRNPGRDEVWYNGVDEDCDGWSDYDQDGDGVDSSAYGGTDCDDTDPSRTTGCRDGRSRGAAALSCRTLRAEFPGHGSGVYWLDPDGDGNTGDAFQAHCEMVADGGGWTLLAWTGNSSSSPYGVPYPGLVYCAAFNCLRGGGVPSGELPALLDRSREFVKAADPAIRGNFGTIDSYRDRGKYTYDSLTGLRPNYASTTCSSGAGAAYKTGTFTSLTPGQTALNGTVVYLNQGFAYSTYTFQEGQTYIWNVGVGTSYCNGNGQMPGSWMGNWSSSQYGPISGNFAGAHAVWVR